MRVAANTVCVRSFAEITSINSYNRHLRSESPLSAFSAKIGHGRANIQMWGPSPNAEDTLGTHQQSVSYLLGGKLTSWSWGQVEKMNQVSICKRKIRLELANWDKYLNIGINFLYSSVTSSSVLPHGLQHARLPCPSPSPGACSNSCPWGRTELDVTEE